MNNEKTLEQLGIRVSHIGDDCEVALFRSEDVCRAMGFRDYFRAMLQLHPRHVITFSHPDSDAEALKHTCITEAGVHELFLLMDQDFDESDARDVDVLSAVTHYCDRLADEQAA